MIRKEGTYKQSCRIHKPPQQCNTFYKLYARDIEKPCQLSGHNNHQERKMVTLKPTDTHPYLHRTEGGVKQIKGFNEVLAVTLGQKRKK